MRPMTGRRAAAAAAGLAVVLVAVVGLGACSDGKAKFNTVGARISDKAATAASSSGDAAGGLQAAPSVPKGPAAGSQATANRDVIYRGTLTIQVGDAPKAASAARRVADDAGGYLADQQADLEGTREVRVTLRVPADAFDQVMDDLAGLGSVHARKITSEDVTDQVVDLQGRLENARTSADRLRELLAKAENVQNVIAIEDRLTQRETEIEALSGQLEVVKDQVKLATVTATLTERDQASVNTDLPGPLEALRSGGVAFVNVVLAVLVGLAYALPFLVTLAVAWWLWRRWRRAHPKVRPEGRPLPPPPAGAGPPPPAAAGAAPEGA